MLGIADLGRVAMFCALLSLPRAATAGDEKAAFSLFRPTPEALLRDMSTDRPDKTESPYTVDAGRIQVEMDIVSFTSDENGSVVFRAWDIAPFNVKFGLSHDSDLQLFYGSYGRVTTIGDSHGVRETLDGSGDLVVRLKRNLWGNDGGRTAFALMPFIKLPINAREDLNDALEGGLIVPLAIDIGNGVGIGLMTEIDVLRNEEGSGYSPAFVNSATIGFDVTQDLGVYLEIFAERSMEDGAELVLTFDTGFTLAVTDNIQFDAGVNLGLTEAADDLNLFVGQSVRF